MKLLFSLLLAAAFSIAVPQAGAQKTYGASTFALDTLADADAGTFTIPLDFSSDRLDNLATWQVKVTSIGGTLTYDILVEETIDDDGSPDYVTVDTIKAAGSATSSSVHKYMVHVPVRGVKQRLRATSTGSSASASFEVDCIVRRKVNVVVTDEYAN